MRPAAGEVLHFSEDPTITRFVPHVPATGRVTDPYVWAVDTEQAPSYWFPRQCPRVLAWRGPRTTVDDLERIVGPGGGVRVHAVEYAWLERIRTARLWAYRLPAQPFRPIGAPRPYAMVATAPVTPLGPPVPVGDLLELHAGAGIQLRILPDLHAFFDAVAGSSLEFSAIRMRHAVPRDAPAVRRPPNAPI
jgi:hypothetical protein